LLKVVSLGATDKAAGKSATLPPVLEPELTIMRVLAELLQLRWVAEQSLTKAIACQCRTRTLANYRPLRAR
jgi:hypothetical protein